ncbi:hypothetical protein [Micromonospora sp. NPDC051006]|uniref:hypothetical protein n=1 Tax=Micromonospora sp. NPDC051006 TaxID=3364283 RepID=UPI00379BFE01
MLLLLFVMRPGGNGVVAPLRLAAARAALLTGAFAILLVEVLGALHALTRTAFAVAWLLFLVGTAVAAGWRHRRDTARGQAALAATPGRALVGATAGVASDGPALGPADDSPPAVTAPRPATTPGSTRAGWSGRLVERWRALSRGERLLAGTVGGLVLVELVIALLAEPNNFDSQTYHLPRVERWVAQGDLDFWPTAIHRQVTIPPGAEYLLLHLRLLTDGDALHNLVQWAAGVLCLLLAARITAQLGGGRRAQLLTAFLLATTPMVALQATSTQTDLTVAAWVACAATLVLDGLRRRTGLGTMLGLGMATGLTAVTKTSGLIAVGPLLVLWGLAQLRLSRAGRVAGSGGTEAAGDTDAGGTSEDRPKSGPSPAVGFARTVGGSVLILLVGAILVGPYLARMTADFGHPLGPPGLRESIPMERHDPPSILVNALRIGHTAFDTPLTPLRWVGAEAIIRGAEAVGLDPQDPDTTFVRQVFPVRAWYPDEDRVAFPLAGSLALLGAIFALTRPGRISPSRSGALRAYAVVVVVAVVLHTAMIKWQPWGNRLLLYALVVAVPLAGLWLDALFRHRAGGSDAPATPASTPARADGRRRSVAVGVAVTVLATSALAGVLALSYGFPRRLVGAGSVFTTSEWDTRFLRRPQWTDEFRWAAEAVRASGARRIGLVEQNDNWEYPWWLLLRDADGRPPELLSLKSELPKRPPADPSSMDAIVCTGPQAACAKLVPPGWRVEYRGYVGYALPPGR